MAEVSTQAMAFRRAPWRVGEPEGCGIYEQRFVDQRDETDRFLGLMKSAEDARLVVGLHNGHPACQKGGVRDA